ncbi:MAG: hypothetical protein K2O42_01515 [Oscillospiraceae bacterium]|nr:hypothetical protein [Oscillospiraceae bacterium]
MIRLVGFQSQCGQFKSDSGELVDWSNRILRCVSDEDLVKGEYGLKVVEQKLKKVQVCNSLGLSETLSEIDVDRELLKFLNSEISMVIGLTKGKFEVTGFKVLDKEKKS